MGQRSVRECDKVRYKYAAKKQVSGQSAKTSSDSPTNWTEILCGLSRIIVVQSCAVCVQLQHLAMEFLDTMDKIAPVYGGQVEI